MSGPMRAWYCGRCRRVLKVEPKWAMPKGCACKVPKIPSHPTLVRHA